MAAPSSSSLSSEKEMKDHPYQIYPTPEPRGAYEARQVKDMGFYVRVDMPGVPPDGVKLVKYGETQTVTFSGKAAKYWPHYDSSSRVYGGYVVLDRDPNQIEVELTVKNGCMRLFFPGSEGTLHFLGGLKRAPNVEDRGEDDSVAYTDNEGSHCLDFSVSPTIAFSHINPFLMQGVEGIRENRVVDDQNCELMYLRMDMPGASENSYRAEVVTEKKERDTLFYGAEGKKEHRLDQGGRAYFSTFTLYCGCCQIDKIQHQLKHGVFRALISKRNIQEFQLLRRLRDSGSQQRKRR